MAKTAAVENAAKLIILFALLKSSLTETPRSSQRDRQDSIRNKSVDNQYTVRNYHGEKALNHRYLATYRETKPPFVKEKLNVPNRDFYRKSPENKGDFPKTPSEKWTGKEIRKEEDYLRKANRDALIGKAEAKASKKNENFESYNAKVRKEGNGEERPSNGNAFRNDESYPSQKHLNQDEGDEYSGTTRQRKMKKHGGSGFVNFPMPRERKPNIILILTDDQDIELGSLNFMPKTLRLLRDGGADFRHAYVTTPMCCPSRSSLLTGMYVHNHNVFTNNENCSNVQWQQTHETRTFATYLSNAGYRTGYFGKYLNKYNGSYIPPGWREWGGLIMNSRYYNYSINLNGKKIRHGFDYHRDYYPDLIANDSITFLRQSKTYFSRKPVMLVVSFPAPHGPEDSAPQYSKMFFNVTTHHTPSYDFAPNPDKQWILQVTNKMQDIHKRFTDVLMTKRLQTLQSVDSAVERIYQELKNIGELDNTYIIYTSDHGYHLGQFGLVKGKSFPFEFDVRVPFLVRGPGIEPGIVVDDIVLNIDLAPTFLDIAGVEPPLHMDGRSIVRLLHHRPNKRRKIRWPDTFLIESSGRREMPESAEAKRLKQEKLKAKEARLVKEKESGRRINEDVNRDLTENVNAIEGQRQRKEEESSETDSIDEVDEENSEEEEAAASLNQELLFRGLLISTNSDSQVDNKIPQLAQSMTQSIPKLARLALECQNPGLQSPCQPGQKWHCVVDGDRWRKFKCKFQRKCTCFTPNGFVYTGLYNEEGNQKVNFGKKRSNDFDLWNRISETMDTSTLLSFIKRSRKVLKRKKRETSEDHISDIWDDLEHELLEAEETKSTINATFGLGQELNLSRCSVTPQGKVNCSSLVYNDYKVWKQSRDEIDNKIKRLKTELDALKEIRKHLKEKRPELTTTTVLPLNSTGYSIEVTEESRYEISNFNSTTEIVTQAEPETEFGNETLFTTSTTKKYSEEPEVSVIPRKSFSSAFNESDVKHATPKKPGNEVTFKVNNQTKLKSNEDGLSNRINGVVTVNRGRDRCICRLDGEDMNAKKEEKEARRKLKEEKLRKKERRLKKKAKLEKECLSEKMNCFIHDNEHWKTPPLWTEGPFCFCMNAINNTYSCLRTINATHNFLYCEFTTGFRTFYNLRIDPFEQLNRISTLTPNESRFLSNQLADMKACKGTKECTAGSGRENNSGYGHHYRQHHQHYHSFNPAVKRASVL